MGCFEIPEAQRAQEIAALSRYCDAVRDHDALCALLGHDVIDTKIVDLVMTTTTEIKPEARITRSSVSVRSIDPEANESVGDFRSMGPMDSFTIEASTELSWKDNFFRATVPFEVSDVEVPVNRRRLPNV